MRTLTLFSPIKLNLFLHIVGRRPDGYHLLQTVFQFLHFGDTLRFALRQDAQIHLHSDLDCPSHKNLVWRAARCLQEHTQTKQGIDISLQKRVPIGAGLGGGSADAATTLVALNYLWQTGLSTDQLMLLGQSLGADVPIFVYGKTSWAEGIGERLTEISLPESWYVVLIPPCAVITAEIFSHPQLTRNTPVITREDFLAHSERTRNDFEPLVRELYPPIGQVLDWLSQYSAQKARLTGSGSAVFASFSSQLEAEQVLQQKPAIFQGFVAQGMGSCGWEPLRR